MAIARVVNVETKGRVVEVKGEIDLVALDQYFHEKGHEYVIEACDGDAMTVSFSRRCPLNVIRRVVAELIHLLKQIGYMVNPNPVHLYAGSFSFYDPVAGVH